MWNLFLKQDRKCALSGEPIQFSSKVHKFDRTDSMDRIDSSKGYTRENVQWLHKHVNLMKWDFTVERFKYLIDKIYNNGRMM